MEQFKFHGNVVFLYEIYGRDIDYDTFIPAIDTSQFEPWYSSFPVVENGIHHCFTTYIRMRNSAVEESVKTNGSLSDSSSDSTKFDSRMYSFLLKKIFENHEEYLYLRLVEDIISNDALEADRTGPVVFLLVNKFLSHLLTYSANPWLYLDSAQVLESHIDEAFQNVLSLNGSEVASRPRNEIR
ncbi:hypothetical protein L1987_64775 [Smallanthus sonchifolius]|uniref:Uncharacterized protein n=1 Tax=Smallanthus sonchifolius TaxID=185202 RepID=A0ACB9BSW6_9ASTR|nr:hypothetical protein L1987_64775 [Smallanthus sonchifolius]